MCNLLRPCLTICVQTIGPGLPVVRPGVSEMPIFVTRLGLEAGFV